MIEFDPIDTPLGGKQLIEASAGTGKTYAIVGLYLRLIVESQLTVDQILVVTYTKAATDELKTRIRSKLRQAQQDFLRGSATDNLVEFLIKNCSNPRAALQRLVGALIDFDRAAIYTLHGFCQRILQEHAFETGNLYDTELIPEPSGFIQELSEDFWRIHITPAAPEFVRFLFEEKNVREPLSLQRLIEGVGAVEYDVIPDGVEPEWGELTAFRAHFDRLVREWRESRPGVAELLRTPSLSARSYGSVPQVREAKIAALVAAMDRYTDPHGTGFPLFAGFEKFTRAYIARSTKKKFTPPVHPFFDTAEALAQQATELETEMNRNWLSLKRAYLGFVQAELKRRKANRNVQFYDDLLAKVKAVLDASAPRSEALLRAVREQFKAALVDEFQDTDPVQYAILSRLFDHPDVPFFTIGDPKQSIYSFRGADIFAYMAAASEADAKYTLSRNWRSRPELIAAVNHLYSGAQNPFLFKQITFNPAEAAQTADDSSPLQFPALHLWYLPGEADKAVGKTDAVTLICEAVGDEIAHITTDPSQAIEPGDIAILVRTNRQAQLIKESLARRHIPAVLYSAGNVFDSHEAQEIERLLTGIAALNREERFRAALVTDLLGLSGDDMAMADIAPQRLEAYRDRFHRYAREWRESGFIRMFRRLMVREGVHARLLAFPDGERRLTNLMHLSEILHQVSIEQHLNMPALLKWLGEQRATGAQRLEAHQLRLESDAVAVRIATIHKSKGLEYPVVFCPFVWESSTLRNQEQFWFHDSGPDRRLVLDLGSERQAQHRVLAQHELLAENLRLLYVALTRAKNRCYLTWGRINTAETSALAYLLHGPETAEAPDIIQALKERLQALKDSDLLEDLQRLVARSADTISLSLLPIRKRCDYQPTTVEPQQLSCRKFRGSISRAWRITSYSSLISRVSDDPEKPEYDWQPADPPTPATISEPLAETTSPATAARDIFNFPKGARTGIFFHDLFEHLDFADRNAQTLIASKLLEYGFDADWQDVVEHSIDDVVRVRLHPQNDQLHLLAVVGGMRVNEMAFYFPLKTIRPKVLQDVFSACLGDGPVADIPTRIGRLTFSPCRGFFKGFIDLVFKYQDRYYLLDWKTNYLGDRLQDYHRENLGPTMLSHYYHLQYHLYTLALNRYLAQRVPGYRYEDHFGGVFYLFIRGVRAEQGNAYGVYYDLPAPECIAELDRRLIPKSD